MGGPPYWPPRPYLEWTLGRYGSSRSPGSRGCAEGKRNYSGVAVGTGTHPRSFKRRDCAPGPRTLTGKVPRGPRPQSQSCEAAVEGGGGGRRGRAEEARPLPAKGPGKVRCALAENTSHCAFCCVVIVTYPPQSYPHSGQGRSLSFLSNPVGIRMLIYTNGIGDYISLSFF